MLATLLIAPVKSPDEARVPVFSEVGLQHDALPKNLGHASHVHDMLTPLPSHVLAQHQ